MAAIGKTGQVGALPSSSSVAALAALLLIGLPLGAGSCSRSQEPIGVPQPPPVVETAPEADESAPASQAAPESTNEDVVVVPGTDERTGPGITDGSFRMGRPLRQGFTDEQPVHLVKIKRFWLDRTAVTNEEYAEFLNATVDEEHDETWIKAEEALGLKRDGDGKWSAVEGRPKWPVVGVTWFGAEAYCKWKGGRLPTEAEWEWAAVGPDWLVYPWGDEWDPSKCCCKDNPGDPYVDVDSYPEATSWCGALNLAGNCWEWCADWYGPYPEDPAENPTGPAEGAERVIRGGFYNNAADLFRGSCRLRQEPTVGRDGIGFRCAYDSSPD
jgi:formylglycine-generating enzyme required for sulfatase activity